MYTPTSFGIYFFAVWPLIIFFLYKKFEAKPAIFVSIALSTLLLPAAYEVDYPLLPPLDRHSITSLALLVILFFKKQKNTILKPGTWNKFFIAYVLVIVISTLTNMDAMEYGGVFLVGATPYDVISNTILYLLWFMPFFFGRNFFNNLQDTEYMFKALAVIALIYSVAIVYELKFSPHLHETVYGYFPGNFIQQIRDGGFRPVVFIGHGLSLAFWLSIATIAALALFKTKISIAKLPVLQRIPGLGMVSGFRLVIYLAIVLVLCKTVSAIIYLVIAAILLLFFKQKKQIALSFALTLLVMVYPMNATSQYVKYPDILNFVASYSKDRAASLKTRFDNEERLAARALERPLFGWSGWGRARVYDNGRDITVTDGMWIIVLGDSGIIGFVFYYLLLIYPIFLAMKYYRYIEDDKHRVHFATLAIILSLGIFDSVPNTGMMPIHFLLAGALLGQAERLKRQQIEIRRKQLFALNT